MGGELETRSAGRRVIEKCLGISESDRRLDYK